MADAWYLKVPEYTSNTTIEISGVLGAFTVAYELALDIPPYPEDGGNSRYLFDVRRGSGGSSRGWFLQKRDGDVQTTEISNVRINDIAASTSDIFSALKDDICQYTYNRTDDTNGIFAFGSRTNAIEALSGLAVKNIVITDANGVNTIDMSSSGGTGTTLTSDTGNITLTLVDYPADNSQWVLYDDGTGGGEVTVNSLAQPFTESISATVTAAQVTETSISSTAQAFTESNVINVSANITSSISATALAFTASISATVTAPGVNDSSINSFAQAFTESNNVTVFSNLSANIQSQAQAFTESINAVRLIGIDTSISAAAPAFIESLLIQTPTLWTDRAQPINNWQDQTQPSNNWQDRG